MEKNVRYYMSLPYRIELQPDPEAGWFVRVREWPGCMSQGDTPEEALANIREVIPLWLETSIESGAAISEPRPEQEYSGKLVVRLPRSLHRDLAEQAEAEGVSLNQYISVALGKAVGQATLPAAVLSAAEVRPVRPARPHRYSALRERRPKYEE